MIRIALPYAPSGASVVGVEDVIPTGQSALAAIRAVGVVSVGALDLGPK